MLVIALVSCIVGCAWLALAMDVHWRQVRSDIALTRAVEFTLRILGAGALIGSFALCLAVDHASMASLVWIMGLAAAALVVAFTLSWRPHLLAPLVLWVRASASGSPR
jgi:hypothetical protein